jgi:hypothetical protein
MLSRGAGSQRRNQLYCESQLLPQVVMADYGASTNAVINEGNGMSIAWIPVVIPLGNMEF